VNAAGEAQAREWQYGYGSFDNGVPIPETARRMYFALGDEASRFGSPFETNKDNNFFQWLNEGAPEGGTTASPISRLWHEVYKEHPEVRYAFPDIFGQHRREFLDWAVQRGAKDCGIPARFLEPLYQESNRLRRAHGEPRVQDGGTSLPYGVNLVGNFRSEKGVGEAVRGGLANLQAANIPYLNPDTSVTQFSDANPYRFNLVWLNADTVSLFSEQRGAQFFQGHYNIAHWAWEIQDFPAQWAASLYPFDEIWVASEFVREGLARVSPVPVHAVPYSISLPAGGVSLSPELVGFPRNKFVFLFIFDLASYAARKNPRGVIRAFQKAFRKDDDALLVLKCAHSAADPAGLRELQDAAGDSNILITDAVLGRAQVGALLDAADCYVSLHRAEGFGLTMAEAMLRAKPVIATGYSGNLDFMNDENSYLVRYSLTSIGQDYGPYQKDFVWAEPDADHAAELMRFVFEQRDAARAVGQKAQQDVSNSLSPKSVGLLMERLLRRTQQT
jgi:glycosyltransferase involved in cell wall biosynthesis